MARTAAGRSRRAATLTAPSSPTASAPVGNIASMAGRPAGAAGPFVGRARELTAVAGLIAETDRTGVVLVGGEAGLGKTRLVEEIMGARPETTVVRGGAVPRTTPIPFELIRSAVEGVIVRFATQSLASSLVLWLSLSSN